MWMYLLEENATPLKANSLLAALLMEGVYQGVALLEHSLRLVRCMGRRDYTIHWSLQRFYP